jgi:kynurenine formamidase
MRQIIDLSMLVCEEMITFPRVARPVIKMLESHEEYAAYMGTAEYGVTSLTAHHVVTVSDHAGTHIDSMFHIDKNAPAAEGIPLDYCYGDGVVLDFSDKPVGHGITVEDVEKELERIDYEIKPLDIVLIKTGASRYNTEPRYLVEHCGMTRESTLYLIDKGVKVMGIDAPTFDMPVKTMFEKKMFWEAHRVMNEREYYHLENMENLDAIKAPYGFKLSVLPVKWKGSTGAPVRAVAIFED